MGMKLKKIVPAGESILKNGKKKLQQEEEEEEKKSEKKKKRKGRRKKVEQSAQKKPEDLCLSEVGFKKRKPFMTLEGEELREQKK